MEARSPIPIIMFQTLLSVLILHAHPGHGGNMNNALTLKGHKLFTDIGFSSLRFNFRGVGKSDGEHDGSEGELADSAIALDWLLIAKTKPRILDLWNIFWCLGWNATINEKTRNTKIYFNKSSRRKIRF